MPSVDGSKYEEKRQHSFISPGEYTSKKEPSKISEKKTVHLYIFPGASTLFYQRVNQNSCILSSLASALHYIGDEYASEYIIRRKQSLFLKTHSKGRMQFCRDILMGHHREKTKINSIIKLRYGVHPRHMIYFVISLLIQLCVCY